MPVRRFCLYVLMKILRVRSYYGLFSLFYWSYSILLLSTVQSYLFKIGINKLLTVLVSPFFLHDSQYLINVDTFPWNLYICHRKERIHSNSSQHAQILFEIRLSCIHFCIVMAPSLVVQLWNQLPTLAVLMTHQLDLEGTFKSLSSLSFRFPKFFWGDQIAFFAT